MTSLITLPNEHFAVQVPEGAKDARIVYGTTGMTTGNGQMLHYRVGSVELYKALPPGSYTIVGLASEITEEQAGEIVEKVAGEHRNYSVGQWSDDSEVDTALESFRSLLSSLSLDPQTSLIIKLNKEV